jgi:hypothetical protein
MDDASWMFLDEPWQRLRWARVRWQKQTGSAVTAKAAAESMRFNSPETYSAYEREPGKSKHTPLSPQRAIDFGRKFKVNWQWLLEGKGTPFDVPAASLSPAVSRVVDLMKDATPADQEHVATLVEAALRLKTG